MAGIGMHEQDWEEHALEVLAEYGWETLRGPAVAPGSGQRGRSPDDGADRPPVPGAALVHGGRRARNSPWFVDHQAARTESGRPRSSIRLRTVTAIRVSTSWAGRVCERKVSPMMRLYRLIVPSTPALAL